MFRLSQRQGGQGPVWVPTNVAGCLLWLEAGKGITLGTTPLASGTTPPAVTLSGTLNNTVAGLYIAIDGAGARGTATFKWSLDGGSTFQATGVLTAATVALGTTGTTAVFPVGTYAVDNVYKSLVATWADQSGSGNHATQATAAQQPDFVWSGANSVNVVRGGRATNVGLSFAGISQGSSATLLMACTPSTSASRYLISDANSNQSAFITDFSSKNYEWYNGADRYTLSAAATGMNVLVVTQVNAGALIGYLNGTQAFSQTASVTLHSWTKLLDQGSSGASAVSDVVGVLAYNTVLSTRDRNAAELYLGALAKMTQY